jgi:zinc D-Ala-D-Ala carboxypeptidase
MSETTQSTPLNETVAITESPLPLLSKNSNGSAVRLLQRFLVIYGYFKAQTQQRIEPVDGDFGSQTVTEVMKFQGDHSLAKDGQVGGLTWCAIAFPEVNPNTKGALRPISNSVPLPLLKVGDRGAAVYVLQRLLVLYSPKYIPNSPINEAGVDGIFGAGTEAAVKIFQTHYKPIDLTPDGQVGNKTWNALIYPNGQR